MNLTDKEILELNDLCNALVDGTITDAQKAELSVRLGASAEARRFYVHAMGLSASLFSYAAEMQTEDLETVARPAKIIRLGWWWKFGSLAAAASILLLLWIEWPKHEAALPQSAITGNELVARLTGSKDCRWANHVFSVPPGVNCAKDNRLNWPGALPKSLLIPARSWSWRGRHRSA